MNLDFFNFPCHKYFMFRNPRHFNKRHFYVDTPEQAIRRTIVLMGDGIKKGVDNLAFRNWVASIAALAPRRDFLEQARRVYDAVIKRWRFVGDPVNKEWLNYTPDAQMGLTLGFSLPSGIGFGDCDCITTALGSAFYSIGFPVLLRTIKPEEGPRELKAVQQTVDGIREIQVPEDHNNIPSHVGLLVKIPGYGLMSVDPILEDKIDGFGFCPPSKFTLIWNLEGDIVGFQQGKDKMIWRPDHNFH